MEAHLQTCKPERTLPLRDARHRFRLGTAKGHPFAYHVYGTAIVGVTVDCLRGRYEVDYVKCCHDFGSSMNTAVDNGQIEGGIVQGLGWMTMEEVVYDAERQAALERTFDLQGSRYLFRPKRDRDPAARNRPRKSRHLQFKSRRRTAADVRHRRLFCDSKCGQSLRGARRHSMLPFTPEKVLMNLYAGSSETQDSKRFCPTVFHAVRLCGKILS